MPSLSKSRVAVYRECPYKYRLGYHEGLPEDPGDTSAADVGTMVHAAFERAALAGELRDAIRFLEEAVREKEARVWTRMSRSRRSEAEDIVRESWSELSWLALDETERLWTELEVFAPLDSAGKVVFHGILDVLVQKNDGWVRVVDYKTARERNEKRPEELASDDQLTGYAVAASLLLGVPLERVEVFLAYVRSRRVHRFVFPASMGRTWAEKTVRDGLEIASTPPEMAAPTPSRDACRWCGYVSRCPCPDVSVAGRPVSSAPSFLL